MKKLQIKTDRGETAMYALGGEISLTRRHFIEEESIEWRYRDGDVLEVRTPLIFRERKIDLTVQLQGKSIDLLEDPFGFHCWIYSEADEGNVLKFEFGVGDRETQSFEYCLNFKGWKLIEMPYTRGYMKGRYDEGMDYFRISALGNGQNVYLEDIQFCKSVGPNQVYDNMCAQIKNMPLPTRRGAVAAYEEYNYNLNRPIFPLEQYTQACKEAFACITKRYFELMRETDRPPFMAEDMSYEEAAEIYESYQIAYDDDGIITGKFIKNTGVYARAMKTLAIAFCASKAPQAGGWVIDMWRLLMDQNTKISWYNGRGTASALLIMRDELKRQGLLDQAIAYLKQAYRFNRIYETASQGVYVHGRFEDTDDIGMDLPSTLACILMMDGTPEKLRDMRHFVFYMENFCMGYAPGRVSGYKPDGTAMHHCGYVRAYQGVANWSISRILYMLSGTMFMVGQEAIDRLLHVLKTEFVIYNGVYEPFTMVQYTFDKMRDTSVVEFAHAARALGDQELARMYVTLAECSEKEQRAPYYREFRERGIEPIREQSCHKTLTYSAAAFHRRGKWAAAVRGYSKYVYSMEIWPDSISVGCRYTAFSLFRSFGFLEILNPPEYEGGTNNGLHIDEGFDYRRWPGTTAVHVPLSQIKSAPLVVEDEWSEWLFSDQGFVGGLDSSDENGVFAMKLHGPEKYGLDSFRAIKTYHFYEDMVLCVGSNISSNIQDYPVETTLFQDFGTGAEKRGRILMDNRGNGYLVLSGNEAVLEEKSCCSRDFKDREDTYGERSFGVISHGKAPKDDHYSYLIKLDTTMEEMESLDLGGKLQIIQQDENAHIVKLFDKTNYVFFRKCYELGDAWIDSVSGSCIISVTEQEDRVSLAVCDPDLRFYLGEGDNYDLSRREREKSIYGLRWIGQDSIPARIWVVVNREIEEMKIVGGNAKIIGINQGRTILEFICKDGMTNEIQFKK